jgi:glycosyltransferase involved in cell wall biosynthesis
MKLYLAGEVEAGFEIENHPNIVYLGFVQADKLKEYIRNSRCVVSGSKLPETFGLIALEAIENGKPFVGFNRGAFGEIITNGVNGFVVRNKKQFEKAIEDIAKKNIIFDSVQIKNNSQKYTAKLYLEKLEVIFSSLIKPD